MQELRASRRQTRLEVESLEDRNLLSHVVTFDYLSGIITIPGMPRKEKIVVSYDQGGNVQVNLSGAIKETDRYPGPLVTQIVLQPTGSPGQFINKTYVPVGPIPWTWFMASLPAPGGVSRPADPDGFGLLTAEERLIYQETNQRRSGAGVGSLRVSTLLQEAAQTLANDLAAGNFFSDDTSALVNQVAAVGYVWSVLGGNVGVNYDTVNPAQTLMNQWVSSPPHLANLLRADFTDVGIGVAHSASGATYGVMVFAAPG
jgi:uncharacterized protein YkwD